MIDVLLEFIDRYCGWLIMLIIVLGITTMIWWGISIDRRRDEACAQAWSMARTSSDSVAVMLRCVVGEQAQTVVVPVPIYVR